ncbi:MAG: hypothetical protein IID16_06750 [Candidatus Marinimicrobia bacterium]|nr:hypothetical protein [Candidatus Neomarinimicrobiota bacterium]
MPATIVENPFVKRDKIPDATEINEVFPMKTTLNSNYLIRWILCKGYAGKRERNGVYHRID